MSGTKLPNGLTVILVEDARFPLATARLNFQAGSKFDPKEITRRRTEWDGVKLTDSGYRAKVTAGGKDVPLDYEPEFDFGDIKKTSNSILHLNQDNMEKASRDAGRLANESLAWFAVGLALALALAVLSAWPALEASAY